MSDVSIRRAVEADLDFLVDTLTHDEVRPYLAAGRSIDRETLRAELEEQASDPGALGRFVVELDGEPAATLAFERLNVRSRIARCGGLAVHPRFRGRRLADTAARLFQRHLLLDLGFHRLQLEIYGFNERAIEHAERAGFILEGRKRKAYWRHDQWVDGVLFGLVLEDLDD